VHNVRVRRTRLIGAAIVLAGLIGVFGFNQVASDASASTDPPGEFTAVSCVGPTYCLAVGTAAASWNGQSWRLVPKPAAPSGTVQEFMNAVSCPQVDDCLVVGTFESRTARKTLADQWNGHEWSALKADDTTNAELDAVSCPTNSWCMAGGGIYSGGHSRIVAGTWDGTGGGDWTLTPITPVAGTSSTSVGTLTCASATVCVEVGSGINAWNGQSWSMVPTSGYAIDDASCQPSDSVNECLFLGAYASGGKFYSDTVQYNGSSWQLVGATSGSTQLTGNPDAFSCAPSTSCFAVGQQSSRARGGPVTFTEHWNGENWAAVASPSPNPAPRGSRYDAFFAVSCVSADSCTAVGRANDDLLAEHWNGTQWQVGRFS
jgi:hypothetical protein